MTIPRFAATSILVAICLVSRSLAGQRHPLPQSLDAQRARGTFEIVSCSLGCAAGVSGISCSIKQVHVNEVLRLTFNRPIDPGSVNNNSFRLIDSTGRTPAGSFSLDRLDPRTLVYRPQLTFDSAGNPMFGLEFGRVYLLSVPGTNVDPLGPYITSEDGLPNRLRMQCSLVASLGVADAAPGRPAAKLSVRVVTERDPVTGAPIAFASVPAEGAVDVWRQSPIEIDFADLMNPATLAHPVTGQSSFIRVHFDPDGDLQDPSDQVPVAGSFALALDQERITTRAHFQAQGGLPASGVQRVPGRVVVILSPQIQDLGGNSLANAGSTSFTTEAR